MNGWRDEYTQFEWLQMGLLLVGMPVAAVVGALLGMVGRWKQGRVLTAALVGMGGAAFVSVALFLLFLAVPLMTGDGRRLMLLDLFDSTFSRSLPVKALIATGGIALLTAVGLRLRMRDPKAGVAAMSMRQLMLLQLFSFIALGCWTGMRFIALDSVSGYERAHRKWSKHDWVVTGNSQHEPSKLYRAIGATRDYDGENSRLRMAGQEPWLEELHIEDIHDASKLDMRPLREAKQLKLIRLSFWQNRNRTKKLPLALAMAPAPKGKVNQQTVDQLGEIGTLQALWIQGGDFSADLKPLSKLNQLNQLTLSGSDIDPRSFSAFAKASKLPQLTMSDVSMTGTEHLQFPAGLIRLSFFSPSGAGFDSESLKDLRNLRQLSLQVPEVTEGDLKIIAALPSLQYLDVQNVTSPKHLECLATKTELVQLTFRGPITVEQHAEYRQLLMMFAELPKLTRLSCPSQFLFEDGGPGIANLNRRLSEEEHRDWLSYLEFRKFAIRHTARNRMEMFQARIDFRRDELKLGKLKLEFADFEPKGIWSAAKVEDLDPGADLDSIGP